MWVMCTEKHSSLLTLSFGALLQELQPFDRFFVISLLTVRLLRNDRPTKDYYAMNKNNNIATATGKVQMQAGKVIRSPSLQGMKQD